MSNRILHGLAATLLFAGCASSPASPPRAAATDQTPSPPVAPPASPARTNSVVSISDDIRKACGIRDIDAHFDFDSAELRRGDYPTLGKVAQCFTAGPLEGRALRVVGHTDPRGDSGYNLVLGNSRADHVGRYLNDEGLSSSRIATVSRGENDARGNDELSWAQDRRVDLLLAN